jgi:hypothetical protein
LTDWTGTLEFAQFNSNLGTLDSVTIDISGSLSTTLTVTNNGDTEQSGSARTELRVGIEDPNNLLGFTEPPNNGVGDNPAIDVDSPKYFFDLAAGDDGGHSSSGLLTASYDSGALTYTLSAILNEFSNPGGGTVTLNAGTFTQTTVSDAGGNASASQVTDASLTGIVTYNYAAVSSAPEPATMAMMGGALIGLGLLRKRLIKKN